MWQAFTLQLGYNAAIVTIGAAALGAMCGIVGVYLILRGRALVGDMIAHAALPGLVMAFIVMTLVFGEGRSVPALLLGSALSVALALGLVRVLSRHTILSQDAILGIILSSFFGFGVVLLTIVQQTNFAGQAGLESYLVGSTAGMQSHDVVWICAIGALSLVVLWVLRRPLLLMIFDPVYAETQGVRTHTLDRILTTLALLITLIALKLVGLVLVVALLLIPAMSALLLAHSMRHVLALAGGIGAFAGYFGAAYSATAPHIPTGPVIVLSAFAVFVLAFIITQWPRKGTQR